MPAAPLAGPIRRVAILLRSSFWFVPACLMLASIVLALGFIELDRHVDPALRQRWPRVFAGGADGSRAMLSAIASSMITVAGVVFSITIVALAQAATQYTSRVLRNFMRDRINQAVLGVFVGVFTYCILVLQAIGDSGPRPFVPALAAFAGVVLAVVAIGFLIVHIHHVAASLQAGEIARTVMLETRGALQRLFPDDPGHGAQLSPPVPREGLAWQPLPSSHTGYVQSAQPDALLDFAVQHDTLVRMDVAIGGFVAEGRPLAHLALAQPPDAVMVRAFNRLYAVDSYRTADQDPEFGFRQLVDIALKALSPAINDTTTAVTCIDYLSVLLEQVARRDAGPACPSGHHRSRVIARGPGFAELADLAFGQILENAGGNTVVLLRLLRMVEEVAGVAPWPEGRRVLAARVEVIEEVARCTAKSMHASGLLAREVARARAACA